MTTPVVRLFRSTDTGAPVLSGTAGAFKAVLEATLKDGYNPQTVTSITRSGSTATVSFSGAHGYATDGLTIVNIAGCDQSEYNGDFQISNVSANTFQFSVTGTPATPATAAGTIQAKVAPAGWTREYTATNKAVYRAPSGNRLFLRVDDSAAQYARVRVYESMTDVDTGTGPCPTDAQISGGGYINKSDAASGSARNWVLIADGYEVYFFAGWYSSYSGLRSFFHFGESASEMSSDPYGTDIICEYTTGGVPWSSDQIFQISSTTVNLSGHYVVRAHTQIGASVAAAKIGNNVLGSYYLGRGVIPYPSPPNNALYVSPIMIITGGVPRSLLKGLFQPLHTAPIGHGGVVPIEQSPIGRRLYAVGTAASSSQGEMYIDIDGPWR